MLFSDDALAERLFDMIPILHDRLVKPFESVFRDEWSPMQFYTLIALHRGGCMTMSELAAHFGIPKQQMTKIVNHLVEWKVAVRQADPADRRLVKICATEHAGQYIEKYQGEVCRQINLALGQLGERDKLELLGAMHTIHIILPKLMFQNKTEEET